jgi:hypothetical protein
MSGATTKKNIDSWRVMTAIIAASMLTFSTLSSTAYLAYAQGEDDKDHAVGSSFAKLQALPKKSLVDDGNSQLLKLQFKLETGNKLEVIRVTIDKSSAEEKVVEFDGQGHILSADPAFELVFGSTTLLSDGYAVGPAEGKFIIAMNKNELGDGTHTAFAEVVLDVGTLTAEDKFTLEASKPLLPDLVAKYFFAPTTMKVDRKYPTFTIETNEGNRMATEHKVQVYLSDDSTLSSGDKMLGQETVKHLQAGNFRLVPVVIDLPKKTTSGQHDLIVKVDAKDKIQELSEDNNVLSKQTNVMPF